MQWYSNANNSEGYGSGEVIRHEIEQRLVTEVMFATL
jgi:hypothetical protein